MYRVLLYPTGRAVSVLIMRGRINATSIVYLNDYDMFFLLYIYIYIYICFMGVDYTHMRSFVIDNSWSYEIILRV